MRKFLIAAAAAVSVIAITAPVASAQGAIDLKVDLKPTKAGTAKKPKSTKIHFVTTNSDVSQTAESHQDLDPEDAEDQRQGLQALQHGRAQRPEPGAERVPQGL